MVGFQTLFNLVGFFEKKREILFTPIYFYDID